MSLVAPKGGIYPCLGCTRFVCELGQPRCELCEYGHTAKHCPHRIDVSTYAEEAYVHGPCREKDKQVPEIDFKFTSGSREYHVKGDMQTIDKKNVGFSPSSTEKITITLWGSVEVKVVHAQPHYTSNSGDARHKVCLCQCAECDPGDKCGCKGCSCGSRK